MNTCDTARSVVVVVVVVGTLVVVVVVVVVVVLFVVDFFVVFTLGWVWSPPLILPRIDLRESKERLGGNW